MITVGSDFSGVGAFNQALNRLGIKYKEIFACDMDKYARMTFIHNYGEPEYYPTNVYERKIPSESLDIYMTSPPCQAFSLAGKRLGKNDKRGILFFNSLEFIQQNNPRYFIFENVKGLLSDDNGRTFNEWINFLGGKSVNGSPVLFPYDDAVNYHLYWKVLNAKDHGVPQNRERVFLIGIRDDKDNNFRFPAEEFLTKKLKDVLEYNVNEKYFLSDKMISWIKQHREKRKSNNNFPADLLRESACIPAVYQKMSAESIYVTSHCAKFGNANTCLKIKSANLKGYEIAEKGDSINLEFPESKTRRGRVGKGVAQTLDTGCNQRVICGAIRGRGENNEQQLELNSEDYTNSITTVQKDNVIVSDYKIRRLTPRECFRLMDFPDSFTWPVSDTQAYKQAGNSIVVNVLYKILKNLNL